MGDESIMALVKARSMLIILLATCEQSVVTLEAASNALDVEMTEDLCRMIGRTHDELAVMDAKLAALRK